MAELFTFTVKSQAEIRNDILRTLRYMLIRRGVSNPNVSPDSDFYVFATAVANEIAVAQANGVIKADEQMPDTADDDEDLGTTALSRIAAILGLSKRAAGGSVGFAVLESTAATTVTEGDELQDALAQRYAVTVGGSYADGESIPVQAVSTGKGTNLAAGTALTWVHTPAYASDTALVGAGGLVNGTDAETNEELRARIYAFFQSPPASGNASHVAAIGEASDARVQKFFVYPAIEGPSTVHAAATASPTTTNKSRVLAASILSAFVVPYVHGQLPEHCYSVITTVADVNADVGFALTLPEAPTAAPPGPGGGWTDGTPWPSVDGTTYFRVTVTAVTSTTRFTCDARTAPTANVSRICWLSPLEWKLYQAKVTTVHATTPGAVEVTIDTPFVGLMTGAYIWPSCQNAQTYVDTVIDAFALMGPGEKSTNASALIRGYRHPRPVAAYPSTLGPHLTNALSKLSEVSTAQFSHRTDGTTTLTGAGGVVTPQVPASVSSGPNIYVPRHIGFWRLA